MTNLEQSQWYAVKNSAGTWEVGTSPERFGQTFATFHENAHIGVTAEVAEHHARLFAAAPKLLEALKKARPFVADSFASLFGDGPLPEIDELIAELGENHGQP